MSDYLTDDEQVERIKQLWKDYGLPLVAAGVLGIGGVIGWDFYESYSIEQSEAAADLYTSYIEARSLGEPLGLIVEELASEHGDSSYYVFVLMREAKAAIDNEDYELALESLAIASDVSEGTPISDMVNIRKARVEFELEQNDEVLETLLKIDSEGFKWQALMLKGDVHFEQDELNLARDAYQAAKDALPAGIVSESVDMKLASVPPAS